MQRSADVFLMDIFRATKYILRRCTNITLAQYLDNEDLRFAVERNFIIVGEAVKKLNQHYPAIGSKIEASKAIVHFRNFVVHQYWAIDDEELWQIIEADVPVLQETIAGLLRMYDVT